MIIYSFVLLLELFKMYNFLKTIDEIVMGVEVYGVCYESYIVEWWGKQVGWGLKNTSDPDENWIRLGKNCFFFLRR